jgi:flagellar motor switch protein FliN/FliY
VRNLTEEQIKEMLNLVGDQEIQNNQIKKAQFSLLQYTPIEDVKEDISILNGIQLELEVELGSTLMNLREVINLSEGEVITLDKIAGDTVDLRANKQWLAYGEVLVLNEVLGIRISAFNKDGDFPVRSVK